MNNNEKNNRMISALNVMADMVGTRQSINGRDVGLGMTMQQTRCKDEAKAVRDGLFRVVIMGTFTSGKSTLINALLGSKVLPESVLPSTAILTFVQYGADADDVEIHFKDTVNADGSVTPGCIEHVTKEQFVATYQYTNEDNEEFLRTGSVARFKTVSYSIIRSSLPLMQNGVNVVDSPGLEDKSVATELALDIAVKAQAIVYMAGERGFAEADREYISKNFKNNPNNVFFILNKIDHIENDVQRQQALEKFMNDVRGCFTKTNGTVDTEMMKKRVFALSALLALDARRGMTFDKDLQCDVPLSEEKTILKMESSKFLPFEESLQEFLSTDERCTAQYGKVFSTLIDTYNDAVTKVRSDLAFYETQGRITAEQKTECERIISEIETSLSATEAAFDKCTLKLQGVLGELVRSAIDNVDQTWEIDLATLHENIRFGMKEYLSLAIGNINVFISKEAREENMKRLLQPFSEIIAYHISDKIDIFMDNNKSVLENAVREAEEDVNINLNNVSSLFQRLGETITESPEIGRTDDQNWLQALVSYCIGDASMIVKNCAGSKTGWVEFIRKAVFNALWQWLVIQIMTGGWGIIVCGIIEWLQIRNGKNEMVDRMLTDSKNGALKEIHNRLDDRLREMGLNIASKVNQRKEEKCKAARCHLQDEKSRLEEIEHNLSDNTFNISQERKRTEYIIETMKSEIKTCYFDIFGNPYTEELATI